MLRRCLLTMAAISSARSDRPDFLYSVSKARGPSQTQAI